MKEKYAHWVFLGPTIVLIVVFGFLPLFYNVYISLYHYNLAVGAATFVWFQNYFAMSADWHLPNSLQITLTFIVVAVATELTLGLGLALLFSKDIRRLNFLRILMLLPMVTAPIAVGLTWRVAYQPTFGIIDYFLSLGGLPNIEWLSETDTALLAVVIVDVWEWTPFMFIILLAGLRSLPREPFEAAKIDGAGAFQTFGTITLPLLRTTILIAVLFRLLDAIRIYDIIVVLTRGGPALATDVLSFYIYRVGFGYLDIGYAGALSILFLAFGSILVLTFIRLTRLRLQ
jgi:multiple sugar transport system permease protein